MRIIELISPLGVFIIGALILFIGYLVVVFNYISGEEFIKNAIGRAAEETGIILVVASFVVWALLSATNALFKTR